MCFTLLVVFIRRWIKDLMVKTSYGLNVSLMAMFGLGSTPSATREFYMHGVLNKVYLQNLSQMGATLRNESNEPN